VSSADLHGAAQLGIGRAALGRPAYLTAGRAADLGERRTVADLKLPRRRPVLRAAEEFLAEWLAARPDVDDVVEGSKWGYRYVGGWRRDAEVHEVKDHSPAAFAAQYEQTRALLGERLNFYHVHLATLETGVLDDATLHRALANLRSRGVRIGISTSGSGQAETVRRRWRSSSTASRCAPPSSRRGTCSSRRPAQR
jgi:hypothetical protein